jgi:gamma-glutamyltranspeptidase/glutathione hydrolase
VLCPNLPLHERRQLLDDALATRKVTHYSIVDSAGNAVSNTYTSGINLARGLMITGAGFHTKNNMDDFAAKPGNQILGFRAGVANAIAPGKRPILA